MAGMPHVVVEIHLDQADLTVLEAIVLELVKTLQIYCCTQTRTVPGYSTPMMWEAVFKTVASFSEQPGHLHQEQR